MTPWKPILAAVIIFAAGLAIGRLTLPQVVLDSPTEPPQASRDGRPPGDRRGGQPGRPPWSPVLSEEQIAGICSRMMRDLKLSIVQSNQVATILHDSQTRMKTIADEYLPRTREEFIRVREEIKAVLTEEQLTKYEEGFRRHQARWGRRGGEDQGEPGEDRRDRKWQPPRPAAGSETEALSPDEPPAP